MIIFSLNYKIEENERLNIRTSFCYNRKKDWFLCTKPFVYTLVKDIGKDKHYRSLEKIEMEKYKSIGKVIEEGEKIVKSIDIMYKAKMVLRMMDEIDYFHMLDFYLDEKYIIKNEKKYLVSSSKKDREYSLDESLKLLDNYEFEVLDIDRILNEFLNVNSLKEIKRANVKDLIYGVFSKKLQDKINFLREITVKNDGSFSTRMLITSINGKKIEDFIIRLENISKTAIKSKNIDNTNIVCVKGMFFQTELYKFFYECSDGVEFLIMIEKKDKDASYYVEKYNLKHPFECNGVLIGITESRVFS